VDYLSDYRYFCDMLYTRKLQLIILLYICCLWPVATSAQSILIDSLKDILANTELPRGERVMTMGRLARTLYRSDLKEAVRTGRQALSISRKLKDAQYRAFIHATLGYLYVQENNLQQARRAMDTALAEAGQTEHKPVKGYVWFRKGWLDYVDGNRERAVEHMLQALRLLEGQEEHSTKSVIYHYLASIYFEWKDLANEEKYARLSLQSAFKSKKVDDLCDAYLSLGAFFTERFRKDTAKRWLLDSALFCNRRVLDIAREQKNRHINQSSPAAVALNTANLYWEFYPRSYRDSAEKYINIALILAREARVPEVIANCYGILSEYAMADGNYKQAERIFLLGLGELESDSSTTQLTKSRILAGLANVAEKSGDPAKALKYYKSYMQQHRAIFDAEKLAIAKDLEARYEDEKKEQELAVLQERAAFNKKLNFFYICLAIASVLALLFLFRAYHFRLKSSLQQQQLLAREKEEAHLQAQLQAAEQELLRERQERVQKELLAGALQVEEKKELLQTLREQITAHANTNPVFKQMDRIINESNRQDEDFEALKSDFAEIHPGFFTRLQQKANNSLTRLDLKYCSYILMGLSNKEIANRLGVEAKSIRMARYRIKQKLDLDKDASLDQFIQSLG
jgi:DNA-binding CsgD family transcriptional regulator